MDSQYGLQIEAILDSIREPAILLAQDYRVLRANRAYQQSYGVEGNCAGRTCYDISHDSRVPCWQANEPCPMLEAKATGEPQRVLHIHHSSRGDEHVEVELRPICDDQGDAICFIEIMRQTKAASPQVCGRGMVGRSSAFNTMLGLVQRVASSEATALLLGESGTGKELVAQAIHNLSSRCKHPFVPVECSGLSESLFESELFGHEKGAFTGATSTKPGLVEQARGGTLFLDEVGDIPLALQVKLLRLLETGTYRRVGDVEPRQADFRLVCATHRSLKEMVEVGEFRQDLYYRIGVFPIQLPALRERREDIALLAETLLQRIAGCDGKILSPEALMLLQRYQFPGNIRELRNILERACLLTDGELIQPDSLLLEGDVQAELAVPPTAEIITLDELEQRYLRQVTAAFKGERGELARRLGVSERTLFRKLQQLRSAD
ncbi:MAG: sigma-54-dependent Fis family transcriptional regulator [Chromatiales bacterium]|nr:sigma-54-dependent Fis family transcriptional regulator [Chromatiales bacterium]